MRSCESGEGVPTLSEFFGMLKPDIYTRCAPNNKAFPLMWADKHHAMEYTEYSGYNTTPYGYTSTVYTAIFTKSCSYPAQQQALTNKLAFSQSRYHVDLWFLAELIVHNITFN